MNIEQDINISGFYNLTEKDKLDIHLKNYICKNINQPTTSEIAKQNLNIMEAMATQYEENLKCQISNLEIQATLYETLLENGGKI